MEETAPTYTPELICLTALRQARADFFDKLVEEAEVWRRSRDEADLTREERKLLRSEGVAQIAEFFFVLKEGHLTSPQAITGFLERHNEDMQALLATCTKGYTRFGLSAARVKEAIFKPHQIELVLHESASGKVTFDQRSIGKILTQVMSFESCRTLLILLASTGLLKRRDFRSIVLISSSGKIEGLYRQHLSSIVQATSVSFSQEVGKQPGEAS